MGLPPATALPWVHSELKVQYHLKKADCYIDIDPMIWRLASVCGSLNFWCQQKELLVHLGTSLGRAARESAHAEEKHEPQLVSD